MKTQKNISKKNIGDRIRDFRNLNGLSQKGLAELIGVQYQSVQGWERKRTKPSTENIEKLCDFFNTTPNVLLFGEDSYQSKKPVSANLKFITQTMSKEEKKCLKIFGKLKPASQKTAINLMEALLLKDEKDKF